MIGVDTNVLIRYATQDDPTQAAIAESIMSAFTAEDPGFVGQLVLIESVWVIRSLYEADDESIETFVGRLLDARELVVENSDSARNALRQTRGGREFPDALIAQVALKAGCAHTVTFDRRAAALDGMTLAVSR